MSKELAERLMQLTKVDETVTEHLDGGFAFISAGNPDLSKALEDEVTKRAPAFRERLLKLYEETFTPEELQAAVDFYGSPVGQKIVDQQDVLSEKIHEAVMEYGHAILNTVAELFDTELEDNDEDVLFEEDHNVN